MKEAKYDRDTAYFAAMAIVKTLHSNGLLSDSELRRCAKILAQKFSSTLAQITPHLA